MTLNPLLEGGGGGGGCLEWISPPTSPFLHCVRKALQAEVATCLSLLFCCKLHILSCS